jgi:hypothetical protein
MDRKHVKGLDDKTTGSIEERRQDQCDTELQSKGNLRPLISRC